MKPSPSAHYGALSQPSSPTLGLCQQYRILAPRHHLILASLPEWTSQTHAGVHAPWSHRPSWLAGFADTKHRYRIDPRERKHRRHLARHPQQANAAVDRTHDPELAGSEAGGPSRVRKRPNRNPTATASHPLRVKLRIVTREVAGHWGPTPLAVSDEVPSSRGTSSLHRPLTVFS